MEQIIALIANYLDVPIEDIKSDTNVRDLAGDSLDLLEIMIDIEDHYQIDIPDEEFDRLITVQDIYDYVNINSGQVGVV